MVSAGNYSIKKRESVLGCIVSEEFGVGEYPGDQLREGNLDLEGIGGGVEAVFVSYFVLLEVGVDVSFHQVVEEGHVDEVKGLYEELLHHAGKHSIALQESQHFVQQHCDVFCRLEAVFGNQAVVSSSAFQDGERWLVQYRRNQQRTDQSMQVL